VADKVGALVSREWDNHEVIQVPAGQADAIRALLAITDGVASVEEDSVVTPPEPQPVTAMEEDLDTQTLYVSSSDSGPNDPEYDNQFWWRKASTYGGASGVEDAWVLSEQHERLSIVVIDGDSTTTKTSAGRVGSAWLGMVAVISPMTNPAAAVTTVRAWSASLEQPRIMALEWPAWSRRTFMQPAPWPATIQAICRMWQGRSAGQPVRTSVKAHHWSEPADIVNLSLGADTICTQSLQSAINKANDQGVMVVASAGNNSEDAQDYSPAGCNHVVTVGAVTLRGDQTTFSNHGDTLDVSAFGQQVRVQGPDGHRWMSGTSFSAPITSGILGLIRQDIPQLDPDTLRSLVLPATTPLVRPRSPWERAFPTVPTFRRR